MKQPAPKKVHSDTSPLVILESPFRGTTKEARLMNIKYAQLCIRDCLRRGESPIASHLLFTQRNILRDGVESERILGMVAGWAWMRVAKKLVVYMDRGISKGMHLGIKKAMSINLEIEYRTLHPQLYKEKMGEASQLYLLPRKL